MTAVALTALGAFPMFLVSAYSARIESDLGFGAALYGAAVSSYFAVSSVASHHFGRVVDRIGARRTLRAAAVCAAVSILGVALVARSWPVLALFLAVGGLSNAQAQVASNQALATGVVRNHQGLAFGVKQAAVPVSALVAGSLVSRTIDLTTWRTAMATLAVLPLVAAVLVPALPEAAAHVRGPELGPVRLGKPSRRVLTLAAGAGLAAATGNSLAVFVVTAAVGNGFSERDAGALLAAGSALAVTVRVVAGWWVDRRDSDAGTLLPAVMVAGAVGFALLAVSAGQRDLFMVATLLGFGAGWGWPGLLYYSVVRRFPRRPGAVTGTVLSGAFMGMLGGPVLFGLLSAGGSFTNAWWVASMLLGSSATVVAVSLRMPAEALA